MRSQTKFIEVISPHTEQSIAEVAAAGPADVDGRRQRRAHRVRLRAVGPVPAVRTHRGDPPARRCLRPAARGDGRDHHRRDRRSDHLRPARPGRPARDDDARVLRSGRTSPMAGDPLRFLRRRCPRPQAAGRRGRRDRAVEHAAVPHRHQTGARAAGRLHGGAQARARIPVGRIAFSGDDRPYRPAAGRSQRATGRRRGR